ncbi:MAG: hypothetical protein LLG09_03895 [Negativicutes bacterium]|nr:hypothetical protein [Negativicutes bacterium]
MKKRTLIIATTVMLVLASAFVFLNANENTEYDWIAAETAMVRSDLLTNQKTIATVNGVGLPERELSRAVFNIEVLYKVELQKYRKLLAAGQITQADYQQKADALTRQKNETDVKEKLLAEMIEDEIFYQAAVERGFSASEADAKAYYENVSSKLPAEQVEILSQYAKGLGLTFEEYAQEYILPRYQVKLTIGKLFSGLLEELKAKYPKEAVDNLYLQNSSEYKELVSQLKEKAVVVRND